MSTVIDLDALGSSGFGIQGDAAGDLAGYSVSLAGDINGDGFDDVIVGAPFNNANSYAGQAFVVFGKADGFGTVDLGNLDATDGFLIQGDAEHDAAGFSVSGTGDINGDGFDDIIVGALGQYNYYYGGSAIAYVIFGSESPSSVDLDSLAASDGFSIVGEYGYGARFSVSEAGDINGDGFDDLIIGDASVNGGNGAAYVIFGEESGFGDIDLANLEASAGFVIEGGTDDQTGRSVSSAGDVNGDGFDDLIVGAYFGDNGGNNAGEAYVIFGKESGFATVNLANLSPTAGFVIQGDRADDWAGFSVSAAGDFNGDGFGDVIVGAPLGDNGGDNAGEAYVIFGKESGLGNIDLTNLAASAGLVIRGDVAGDEAGWSVSSAGDVNGDGLDDVIVGALGGDDGGDGAGEAYVIYGRSDNAGVINLTNLAPADGFVIRGDTSLDQAGFSVSGGGDINGDGFADLVVGATGVGNDAGEAYVIFGAPTSVDLTGSDEGEVLAGAGGNDTIDGRGGNDSLYGLERDDQLLGGAGNDLLDGGAGVDTMRGGAGDDTYYVDNLADQVIEYFAAGNDTIYTSISLALADNVENLRLLGSASINATGNGLSNLLVGNSGANVLDGGAGADRMEGGAGNDRYFVGNALDQVVENSSSGTDYVFSSISYALGANLENLRLLGSASIDATGNAGSNLLVGNSGANILDGRAGADRMGGAGGDDTYYVDNALDEVVEHADAGSDTVYSSISLTLADNVEALRLTGSASINASGNGLNNVLAGNSGENVLSGGAGDDKLWGSDGADQLWGGTGADEFAFGGSDFGGFTAATAERIRDFSQAEGDTISLAQVDANELAGGDQAFTFIGNSAFSNVAGELRYVQTVNFTYLFGDTDGDGKADLLVVLDGTHSLIGGDFIL